MNSVNFPLPTTRILLTSLLNSLFATPTPPAPNTEAINPPYSETSIQTQANPLKTLPASQKALLTTLHVLFPPPMLLQALDLLDRGLVTRIIERLETTATRNEGQQTGGDAVRMVMPPQAIIHLHSPLIASEQQDSHDSLANVKEEKKNFIYQVRSSQPPRSRFRDASGTAAGGIIYTVHLEAWGCSCAAFAFSAFPSHTSTLSIQPWSSAALYSAGEDMVDLGGRDEAQDRPWEFGGLSYDGKGGGDGGDASENIPFCKHLLACLLGQRWEVLGGYVKERELRREEMAGLMCEG